MRSPLPYLFVAALALSGCSGDRPAQPVVETPLAAEAPAPGEPEPTPTPEEASAQEKDAQQDGAQQDGAQQDGAQDGAEEDAAASAATGSAGGATATTRSTRTATATRSASRRPASTSSTQQPREPAGDEQGPEARRPPRETTPPPGAPPCRASALTVTDADAVHTADAVHELFTIRTDGPDCTLSGWPTVAFRDAAGRPLAATVRRGGLGLPAATAKPVTISRSTSLSFFVATPRDGACRQAATLVTTLPGTRSAVTATTPMQVCKRTVAVSPVRLHSDSESQPD